MEENAKVNWSDGKRDLIRRPKEEPMEKVTFWFIEPIGSHTNKVIASRLAEFVEITGNTELTMKDIHGKPHSVYQVSSHERVLELYRSQDDFKLTFNVFTRTNNYGPITQSLIDTPEFKKAKQTKKNVKKVVRGVKG